MNPAPGRIGRIRRGVRRGESGQAFTELTVSLIAILAAFVGFLLVAALGSDRIAVLIEARRVADMKSAGGVSSQGGESIREWDNGPDGIPFTVDDNIIFGSAGDGAYFKNELADNTGFVTLQHPPGASLRLNSEFARLQDSDFFVNAASLADGSVQTSDTLHLHNLDSLESAFRWLFKLNGTHVGEMVYMPAHKDLRNTGD